MWARSLAAVLLGLPLTVGLIGLLALAMPGPLSASSLPLLLLAFPVWVACLSLPFACERAGQAWAWMGGLTLLSFGLLHGLKWLGWIAVRSA